MTWHNPNCEGTDWNCDGCPGCIEHRLTRAYTVCRMSPGLRVKKGDVIERITGYHYQKGDYKRQYDEARVSIVLYGPAWGDAYIGIEGKGVPLTWYEEYDLKGKDKKPPTRGDLWPKKVALMDARDAVYAAAPLKAPSLEAYAEWVKQVDAYEAVYGQWGWGEEDRHTILLRVKRALADVKRKETVKQNKRKKKRGRKGEEPAEASVKHDDVKPQSGDEGEE